MEKPLKMRAKRFPKGTLVVTRTGGGGGYGDPRARPENEVLADVLAGTISREAARSLYGVAVTEDGAIDAANTAPRRQEAASN